MRYPASEKLEIIRLVEQSHQPVKRTLEQIGVSRPTFYLGFFDFVLATSRGILGLALGRLGGPSCRRLINRLDFSEWLSTSWVE